MNDKEDKNQRLMTALRDAHNNPPPVLPDRPWRQEVMGEIRSLRPPIRGGTERVIVPPAFYRLAPVLTAASIAVFALAWSTMGGLYNELTLLALTNLPRTVELYLSGL